MPTSVVMPALEMAQETGKLIAWLKKEGEAVTKGEPLLEIETDKAVMEIESPGDGVLGGVKAQAGTEVPVGQTIAWILRPGETVPADEVQVQTGRHQEVSAKPAVTAVAAPGPAETAAAKISPKARRLAKEQRVDLGQVHGSGPGGEILASDIMAAAEAKDGQAAPTAAGRAESLSAIARLMAERTTQSWTTVPHFFVVREIDASALNAYREKAKASGNATAAGVTHTDLLVALVARVLAKHPRVNSSWSGDGIRANHDINIALAIAVDDGVVAPVIAGADKLTLGQIATLRRDLSERARGGKLRPSDLSNGTFTISNLGMFNADAFSAIITPPQAAILAVGRIADRVVAIDGKPAVRPVVTLTLSSDHRVIDGARAARFMDDVAQAMGNPEKWLA